MYTIDKLLEIENNPRLFDYKILNGTIHLWPLIRFQVLSPALLEISELKDPFDQFKIKYSSMLSYLFKTFRYRSTKSKKCDIFFFGSDVANIKTEHGYFNRLSELYANQFPSQTTIIEDSSNFNYKRPRTRKEVFANDNIKIHSKILKFFTKLSKRDYETINNFVDFLKFNFTYSFQDKLIWNKIKILLIKQCKEFTPKYNLYKRFLLKKNAKIIFIEDASYGYTYIPLVIAAKDLNIKVIEYQHGLISLNHSAYNYHENLPHEYLRYLPNYFLVYGTYWKENCRIPVEVIVIGNPYLSEQLKNKNYQEKKNQLLYASGATEPDLCVKRVLFLKEKLLPLGINIIFRPHPSETHRLDTIYKPFKDAGISIDKQNLYETLKETKFVFSDFSTVLFESIAFGCNPIVLKTKGSDLHINYFGIKILNSIEELADFIAINNENDFQIDKLWEKDWKSNFNSFMLNKLNFNAILN